jgi:hypothetical protein
MATGRLAIVIGGAVGVAASMLAPVAVVRAATTSNVTTGA